VAGRTNGGFGGELYSGFTFLNVSKE